MKEAVHFDEALVRAIAERLAQGEPLAVICRDEGMPTRNAVNKWRAANPEIDELMQDARDHGYDVIAARLRETARGKGESTQDVQRDKLIVDTDLKLLAKWDSKRYGERQVLAGDPDNPLVPKESEEAIAARFAALMEKARAS